MTMAYKSSSAAWSGTKEVINTILGLTYTGTPYEDFVTEIFKEIDGDFGIPTKSDLEDFGSFLDRLPLVVAGALEARTICKCALNLYEELSEE